MIPFRIRRSPARPESVAVLTRLAYELLDAHLDTERLLRSPSDSWSWPVHLHYMRDLQRSAREILARAGSS